MVDKKTVEYVAKLACIEIDEEEKGFLGKQLSKILNYIDKLKEVDTQDIASRSLYKGKNRFREDKVGSLKIKRKF